MARFQVSTRSGAHATVDAGNWLTALGLGLDQLGVVHGLDRLACEVLPNGTVIARDARTGSGYVVQQLDDTEAEPTVVVQTPDLSDIPFDPTLDEDTEVFALEGDTGSIALGPLDEDTDELDDDLDLDALHEAADELTAWTRALEACQERVPSEAGSALRLEPGGALRFVVASGPESAKLVGVLLPPGKGVVAFSATRRMGLIVNDAAADRRFYRQMDQNTGFATRSILCVPVQHGGRTWGCLELLNPPGGTFDRDDLQRLEPIAQAVGSRLGALHGR